MKKCPFCAEEIQDQAIKCRFCGSMLQSVKWYFRGPTMVIVFLCVGPLALPLVWLHPRLSRAAKIIISAVVLILSYYLWRAFSNSVKSISSYYQMVF